MDRRAFISGVASGVASGLIILPRFARGQPSVPLIGFVRSSSLDDVGDWVAAFRQGLKETGYVEGQNVAIEFRSADDHYENLPTIIADLIRRHAVVLVVNTGAAQAAKAATTTIPIVFAGGGDPVRNSLVASFSRPGRNITGVSFLNADLGAKNLELIRSLAPNAMAIGVLGNPNSPANESERIIVAAAAHALGQRVIVLNSSSEHDSDAAFARLVQERAGALLVTADALFYHGRDKLIGLAARHAVPTIYSNRDYVAAGGLISYGASITEAYRQVGVYTGRILKGEKPADLPVIQPTKVELVINLKTAKALGLTIPPSLLLRAGEVIQ
jgi:putative tryptophan/tyrosine transport system substrate-binding protein